MAPARGAIFRPWRPAPGGSSLGAMKAAGVVSGRPQPKPYGSKGVYRAVGDDQPTRRSTLVTTRTRTRTSDDEEIEKGEP